MEEPCFEDLVHLAPAPAAAPLTGRPVHLLQLRRVEAGVGVRGDVLVSIGGQAQHRGLANPLSLN